jgi:integrase
MGHHPTVRRNTRAVEAIPEERRNSHERQARDKAGITGKTLHDVRGILATRLMCAGFADGEIDAILGWETEKSSRIRRRYISRKAVAISAIERLRRRAPPTWLVRSDTRVCI